MIIATETWLPPKTAISIRGFKLIVSSSRLNTEFSRFGGCAIFVKNNVDLNIKSVDIISTMPNCQLVQVTFQAFSLFAFYRSPNQEFEEFQSFVEFYESIEIPNFVACGDLNCRNIDWSTGSKNSLENRIFIHSNAMNVDQYVTEPTHNKDGILDVILSTPDIIQSTKIVKSPIVSDHYAVVFDMKIHHSLAQPKFYSCPKNVSAEMYQQCLSNLKWYELNYEDTDQCATIISSWLSSTFKEITPVKCFVPEDSNGFLKKTNDQIRHVRQLRKLNSHSLAHEQQKLDKLIEMEKERKTEAYMKYLQKSPVNIYRTFNKKQFQKNITSIKMQDGSTTTNPEQMACELNSYYASVLVQSEKCKIDWFDKVGPIDNIEITESKVCEIIRNIKNSDSVGPDYVSNRMLKLAAPVIATPLTLLFRSVLRTGRTPSIWKIGVIRPLAKPGLDSSLPKNTRPICCSSVIGKLLERIVSEFMMTTLENQKWFYEKQFGFRKSLSTTDCINEMVETIHKYLYEGYSILLVPFDFSRCFDIVRHEIMLQACYDAGITGQIGRYLQNWTENHYQYVQINEATSPHVPTPSGIFQGSCIAPQLFLILTNSSHKAFKYCELFSYADDTTCLFKFKNANELPKFYADMDSYYSHCQEIKFKLNFQKSSVLQLGRLKPRINLTMGGETINVTDMAKILGITISSTRGFQIHRDQVLNKFKGAAHAAKLMTKGATFETKKLVYTLYLKPLTTYISNSWFDKNILRGLDDVYRSYFSNCKPEEGSVIPQAPSVVVLTLALQTVRTSFKLHNYSNLAACRPQIVHDISTKNADVGKMSLIYPKHPTHFPERPLAHKICDLWNWARNLACETDIELSNFLRNNLAQHGLDGPAYQELLSSGWLICKHVKRRNIIAKHFEDQKSLVLEFFPYQYDNEL